MPELGDLTPDEIERLQEIADEFGEPICVFGSAARGERRGIGTDLPIGSKSEPGTRSDLDLGIPGHMRGGPMEEALKREFGRDIDRRHGILRYFPPAGPNEIEIAPKRK